MVPSSLLLFELFVIGGSSINENDTSTIVCAINFTADENNEEKRRRNLPTTGGGAARESMLEEVTCTDVVSIPISA